MKTLLYAPAIYRHDKGIWPPMTSSTFYYSWQKQLFDFFSTLSIKVIWKAGPRTSNLIDPIQLLKANNIRYSTKPINKELKKCDFLFTDVPSTPVLDAIKMNKPALCVTWIAYKDCIREDCNYNVWIVNRFDILKALISRFIYGQIESCSIDIKINRSNWIKEILNN